MTQNVLEQIKVMEATNFFSNDVDLYLLPIITFSSYNFDLISCVPETSFLIIIHLKCNIKLFCAIELFSLNKSLFPEINQC